MTRRVMMKAGILAGGVLGLWLGVRYVLPVLLPFLLGGGIALAAEPLVGGLHRRLRLKRWIAAGIGVSLVMTLLVGVLVAAIGAAVKQMGQLALPELMDGVYQGLGSLEQWTLSMASSAPAGIRNVLTGALSGFFSGSSAFVEGLAGGVLSFAKGLLGILTSGFFGFATAVLSAFMISARLPVLRDRLKQWLPEKWGRNQFSALKELRRAVAGWFTAQLKLTLVTLGVLLMGFWLLRVPHGVLWATVVALVDLLPVLGCGTVLVPWSVIALLQGQRLQGLGLLGIYGLVWLLRSVLEPKLLGKELGLDPLVTLIAVYTGYQLLGFPGMILAPMLAVVISRLKIMRSS